MIDKDLLEGELISVGSVVGSDPEYISSDNLPIDVSDSADPSDVIKTTQGVRLKILTSRLRKGVPDDSGELSDTLQLLRDLDSAALTTRKIDVEERSVSEQERIATASNELLRLLDGRNPFRVEVAGIAPVAREAAVLPPPAIVPGLTVQGTEAVNYDDFVGSVKKSEASLLDDTVDN